MSGNEMRRLLCAWCAASLICLSADAQQRDAKRAGPNAPARAAGQSAGTKRGEAPAKPAAADARGKAQAEANAPNARGKARAEANAPQTALERENELLRKELDLAEGDEFYLVIHPSRRVLRLMLKGVMLDEYPLTQMSAGVPGTLLHRTRPPDLAGFIASEGELDPPRERDRFELIVGPKAGTDSVPEVPVPPPPEEIYTIPVRFWIRYSGGVAVEIRSRVSEGGSLKEMFLERIWKPIKTSIEDWRSRDRDSMRLLLELSREDAASLYRVLPPNTKLLILP